ncbi:hypothetical protein GJ496_007935 [Pomphorhynchus laevis]|nr:hypothetical protein GJ496_007935 [Pomphorhynchus laevis]
MTPKLPNAKTRKIGARSLASKSKTRKVGANSVLSNVSLAEYTSIQVQCSAGVYRFICGLCAAKELDTLKDRLLQIEKSHNEPLMKPSLANLDSQFNIIETDNEDLLSSSFRSIHQKYTNAIEGHNESAHAFTKTLASSFGPDNLPSVLLGNTANLIAKPLYDIFSYSIRYSMLPLELKTSVI